MEVGGWKQEVIRGRLEGRRLKAKREVEVKVEGERLLNSDLPRASHLTPQSSLSLPAGFESGGHGGSPALADELHEHDRHSRGFHQSRRETEIASEIEFWYGCLYQRLETADVSTSRRPGETGRGTK